MTQSEIARFTLVSRTLAEETSSKGLLRPPTNVCYLTLYTVSTFSIPRLFPPSSNTCFTHPIPSSSHPCLPGLIPSISALSFSSVPNAVSKYGPQFSSLLISSPRPEYKKLNGVPQRPQNVLCACSELSKTLIYVASSNSLLGRRTSAVVFGVIRSSLVFESELVLRARREKVTHRCGQINQA